jgi:hypothetical protein
MTHPHEPLGLVVLLEVVAALGRDLELEAPLAVAHLGHLEFAQIRLDHLRRVRPLASDRRAAS